MLRKCLDAHHTAAAYMIRHQPKVAIRGYKGENSITLPFLVSEKKLLFSQRFLRRRATHLTQGWNETSSKSLGLTKLMVRSGIPVSFTEQSI